MAKPPPDTPSSDIEGVNRDARVNTPNRDSSSAPGAELNRAGEESPGRPDEGSVAGM